MTSTALTGYTQYSALLYLKLLTNDQQRQIIENQFHIDSEIRMFANCEEYLVTKKSKRPKLQKDPVNRTMLQIKAVNLPFNFGLRNY